MLGKNTVVFLAEGKDRIRIKPGYEFKLIAQMIEDGTLPFMPKPVSPEDLRQWNDSGYTRYLEVCNKKNISDVQDRAWSKFLQRGAIGVYWGFGSGKSLFGHRYWFCCLDYGEELSKRFEIPFVYGETSERLDIIRRSQACVVSRVGDKGLSDLKLERIIEVLFLSLPFLD